MRRWMLRGTWIFPRVGPLEAQRDNLVPVLSTSAWPLINKFKFMFCASRYMRVSVACVVYRKCLHNRSWWINGRNCHNGSNASSVWDETNSWSSFKSTSLLLAGHCWQIVCTRPRGIIDGSCRSFFMFSLDTWQQSPFFLGMKDCTELQNSVERKCSNQRPKRSSLMGWIASKSRTKAKVSALGRHLRYLQSLTVNNWRWLVWEEWEKVDWRFWGLYMVNILIKTASSPALPRLEDILPCFHKIHALDPALKYWDRNSHQDQILIIIQWI